MSQYLFFTPMWVLTTAKGGTPGTEIGGLVGSAGGGTIEQQHKTT